MQYAVLGDIQFNLITYFNGLEGKWGSDYAEHARVEGKPRLQWIGDKADSWTLRLRFHRRFCDPEAELARLRKALAAHEAMAFVLGNGDYKGLFVIDEIGATAEHTDVDGALISADVSLALREFPDAPTRQAAKPAVVQSGRPAPVQSTRAPMAVPPAAVTTARAGLAVLSAQRVAIAAVGAWRSGGVSDALGALAATADQALGEYASGAGLLARGGDAGLAAAGAEVAASVNAARALLVGLGADNLESRRAAVVAVVAAAVSRFGAMPHAVATVAATVATRRAA